MAIVGLSNGTRGSNGLPQPNVKLRGSRYSDMKNNSPIDNTGALGLEGSAP